MSKEQEEKQAAEEYSQRRLSFALGVDAYLKEHQGTTLKQAADAAEMGVDDFIDSVIESSNEMLSKSVEGAR